MIIKKIKQVLDKLYYRGISDGMDIVNTPRDRFLGNSDSRKTWEQDILAQSYKDLKDVL